MSVAAQTVEGEANAFQKYLVPLESSGVRWSMQKAEEFGSSENFIYAHVISVAFAVGAVAMSLINAVSYILLIPCQMLVNVISLSPMSLVTDIFVGITNAAKSLLFVSLGVTFVVVGVFFPDAIFSHFAPVRLKDRVAFLEKENSRLEKELEKSNELLDIATTTIQELERKNDRKGFLGFFS